MNFNELYQALENSTPDELGHQRAETVLPNGDTVIVSTTRHNRMNGFSRWGRVEYWIIKAGRTTRSRYSKAKAAEALG